MLWIECLRAQTISSAVAERLRDASCPSVASFSSTICRAQFYYYWRLRLQIYRCAQLISSLWRSGDRCDKQDSLMPQYTARSTVNRWSRSTSHRSDSQIFIENRDYFFAHTTCFDAPLADLPLCSSNEVDLSFVRLSFYVLNSTSLSTVYLPWLCA